MNPEDFQELDEAVADALLADATLATTLNVTSTWRGFFGELSVADAEMAQPAVGPALPAMGAYYRLDYNQKPRRALAGNVFGRFALLKIWIRIQPALVAADSARAKMLAAASAIKSRILALQPTTTGLEAVDAAWPLQTVLSRNSWPVCEQWIGLYMGET